MTKRSTPTQIKSPFILFRACVRSAQKPASRIASASWRNFNRTISYPGARKQTWKSLPARSARKPPRPGSLTCIPTWTALSARRTSSFLTDAPRTSVIGTFTPHSTCRPCDPISACQMNRLFWNTDRWARTEFSSTNRRRFARTTSDAWSSTFMDQVTHTLTTHSLTSWKRKSLPMPLAALSSWSAPPQQALAICERRHTEVSTTPAWKSMPT